MPYKRSAGARKRILGRLFREARGRCYYCGIRSQRGCGGKREATTDHLVPSSLGGSDRPDNLVLACSGCNEAKGSKPQWRRFAPPGRLSDV